MVFFPYNILAAFVPLKHVFLGDKLECRSTSVSTIMRFVFADAEQNVVVLTLIYRYFGYSDILLHIIFRFLRFRYSRVFFFWYYDI